MNENSDAIIILVLMAKSNSKQGEKYNFKSMQKNKHIQMQKKQSKHVLDWEKTN